MAYDIILGRDDADKERFGTQGAVFLGKHYVKMGQTSALSQSIFLDLNKAHVVFVCGKRGSGKCVTGDTVVTLANGQEVFMKDLEYLPEKTQILAMNHDLKIVPCAKEGFFKRTVSELLKVTLRSGRTISLTPEHPLLTIHGWEQAGSLSIGTRIGTPRKLPCHGTVSMPEHELKILAYLIAEGHVKQPLFFTNSDECLVEDLRQALKEFDPVIELTKLKSKYEYKVNCRTEKRALLGWTILRDRKGRLTKGSQVHWQKRHIREFLERHGIYGKLSAGKFIPKSVFSVPAHQLALFLNRLFSCDGSIYFSNGWEVSYSTMSEIMARQLQGLLLRFEVLSKLRTKVTPYQTKSYELVINGESVTRFLQFIGFFGKKSERQTQALVEIKTLRRNPNVDTIPKEIWDTYRPRNWVGVGLALGYATPKAARSSINYSASRQKLLTISEVEGESKIKLLAESDIFWDELIHVEQLIGSFEVYDITVPELHNFVASNIIIHNSYSMGVIAEGVSKLADEVKKKLSVIMLDTMGIYWTMRYPNHKDEELLKDWGLQPDGVPIKIFVPAGFFQDYKSKKIPADVAFSIHPAEFNPEDWWLTFDLLPNEPLAVFIERIVLELKTSSNSFGLPEILAAIQADTKEEVHVKNAAENRFTAVSRWGIFSTSATPIRDLAAPGQITVLDVSAYAMMPNGWKIKHLVMGVVCNKLFLDRMAVRKEEEYQSIHDAVHYLVDEKHERADDMPIVWIMIDEAHEFLPSVGKTAATDALMTLLREGRQPGIALVLATQQPGKIHTDAMTQSDVILAHRLTAKVDTDALGSLLQTYLRTGLDKELDNLQRIAGACLAMDDVNERIFPMRVRPRRSWHGGGAPGIIQVKKSIFGL